jgi:hypothetical protein
MQHAFEAAGIPWLSSHREDRGDGVLVLVPAGIPKTLFVDQLPNVLVDALIRHNRVHPAEEQIRLRLALHAGEITYDDHGVTGSAIIHTFRILDATTVKNALSDNLVVLAIIASGWFFDEVIRHSEQSQARSYRPTDVTNKETSTRAWVRPLRARTHTRGRYSLSPRNGGIRRHRTAP